MNPVFSLERLLHAFQIRAKKHVHTSKSSLVLDFAGQAMENTRSPPGASPVPTIGNTHVSDRPPSWPRISTTALSSTIISGEKLSGIWGRFEFTTATRERGEVGIVLRERVTAVGRGKQEGLHVDLGMSLPTRAAGVHPGRNFGDIGSNRKERACADLNTVLFFRESA